MKNKYILVLFSFLSFMLFSSNVKAGVCDKLGQDYCSYATTYKGTKQLGASDVNPEISSEYDTHYTYYKGYYMRPGYDTHDDKVAICIDPGLFGVNGKTLSNARSLDLSYGYDEKVYKLYQKFISDVNNNSSQIIKYRAAFEFVARMITVKHDYDKFNDSYKNDFGTFVKCAKKIDEEMNTSFGSKITDEHCFGNNDNKELIKEYFSYANSDYIWENPLEKTNAIETLVLKPSESESGKWEYQFKVNFEDFFTDIYSAGVNADKLNLNESYFSYEIQVNGAKCEASGNCNTTDFTGAGEIKMSTSEGEPEKIFTIRFTQEEHEATFPSGSGTIELKYNYGHPMSYDNIFIARDIVAEDLEYQRMLVIDNFLHSAVATIPIGSGILDCTQNGDEFKHGDVVVSIEEYKELCGCDKIDYSVLNDENKTKYNNQVCPVTLPGLNESVSSNLRFCEGDTRDYKVNYEKTLTLSGNPFCQFKCTEDINIKNMVSKNYYDNNPFTAGKHYILPGMMLGEPENERLSTNSTKFCQTFIKYDSWLEIYNNILENMEHNYDIWQEYASCSLIDTTCSCSCGQGCCYDRDIYRCEFYGSNRDYMIFGEPTLIKSDTNTTVKTHTYCHGSPYTTAATYKNRYYQNVTEMIEHLSKLEDCYTTMASLLGEDTTSDEEYYKFESSLEYNYMQTYGKSEISATWNYERDTKVKDINITDEKLTKYFSDYNTSVTLEDAKTEYTSKPYWFPVSKSSYSTGVDSRKNINDEGASPKSDYQKYYRKVSYLHYYRPSVNKYVEAFTGKISDTESYLENPTLLGYYFDLDVSAVANKNNDNNYHFAKLGDKGRISELLSEEELTRSCKYEIKNDFVGCESMDCKLKIVYRSVDPVKLDPNGRLGTDDGFENWDNEKGYKVKEKIQDDASKSNTYNPNNLEYSFTLNSQTIAAIREYNKSQDNSYDKWDDDLYDCINGNECTSDFITQAKNGTIDVKSFATNISGRNKWKYMTKNSSTGVWTIENYDRGVMPQSIFEQYTEELGGITP